MRSRSPGGGHQRPPRVWKVRLKQALYALVILVLTLLLVHLGTEPWIHAARNWPVLLGVLFLIAAAIVVQAQSFRSVSPPARHPVPLSTLTRVWAASSVVSILAPLFGGIAARTVLLIRAGMLPSHCVAASSRQLWMGLEFALLLAALSVPFVSIPNNLLASFAALAAWGAMFLLRIKLAAAEITGRLPEGRLQELFQALARSVPPSAYPWFVLQLLFMTAIYYFGFNGMGAQLGLAEAVALSSVTVVMSLIVFIPNGLGVTDAIWLFIAIQSGLSVEESVALAIVLRLGHLLAGAFVWLSLALGRRPVTAAR